MITYLLNRVLLWRRIWRLRLQGIELNAPVYLGTGISGRLGFNAGRGHIHIENGARLEQGIILHAYGGSIRIGSNVFIGPYSVVYGNGGVDIGDDVLISMHCRILSSNHTIPIRDRCIRWEPDILRPTKIGRDVWLGAGVTVLGGVSIGDGCVVGAGAVVSRDIPPFSIARGIPARVVDQRGHSL